MAAVDLAFYMLLVSLLAIPIVLFFTARPSARGTRLPPGPWALPVLGHLHHFADVAMRDLAQRHGPVMLLQFGEVPVVVASSPAAAREVMRTHDAAFASRPLSPTSRLWFQGAGEVSFTPYGDAWRRLRKVCTRELLSVHRVREDELGRLLRAVAAAGSQGRRR
jgi:cytochrome P450